MGTRDAEAQADAFFHALADRTRRDILRRVLAGEHSVSALARNYDMSFAAVQKHVAVLERAGLITKRRSGREQLATGDVDAIRSVASMLSEFESVWRGRISRIDEVLAADPTPPAPPSVHPVPAATEHRSTPTPETERTPPTEED